MGPILVIAAIIPIIVLCVFIYMKDKNKEPKGLLAGIFGLGILSIVPILICELIFGFIFPMENANGFIAIFLYVFFGVAAIEEFFKWLITKLLGYNNKEFDEVFDVIVYSVFASLGFACLENILYVLQNGLGNALLRAILSIPGHTCFAISMGYFMSKAKVGQLNNNQKIYKRNMFLSYLMPVVLHTFYDAFLFNISAETLGGFVVQMLPFIIFYVTMVIICFITVDKAATVQNNLSFNLINGNIARNEQGYLYYNYSAPAQPVSQPTVDTPVITSTVEIQPSTTNGVFPDQPVSIPTPNPATETTNASEPVSYQNLSYCPICGKPNKGSNFCSGCGFKFK